VALSNSWDSGAIQLDSVGTVKADRGSPEGEPLTGPVTVVATDSCHGSSMNWQ
jgi:hypothetical protein